MTLRPSTKQELAGALAQATRDGRRVAGVDLGRLDRVLQHQPEDMTVKVETGARLGDLQEVLSRAGQWLPIDPPGAEHLTIGELLAKNLSGPRRFGCGTIRDHLIGLQVALADGRLVSSGGNVVKNVAGYDLMKLFIGARHSLGFAVEANFKLLPRPESEVFLSATLSDPTSAGQLTSTVMGSDLVPMVLDWHRGVRPGAGAQSVSVVVGFAGHAEEVAWQVQRATAMGFTSSTGLDYEERFWSDAESTRCHRAVLPSRLAAAVEELGCVPFVARAGNGILHHAAELGSPQTRPAPAVAALARRMKDTFDPGRILPELAM